MNCKVLAEPDCLHVGLVLQYSTSCVYFLIAAYICAEPDIRVFMELMKTHLLT